MPIFDVEMNGRAFEVDAPSMDAAVAALGGQAPKPPASTDLLNPTPMEQQAYRPPTAPTMGVRDASAFYDKVGVSGPSAGGVAADAALQTGVELGRAGLGLAGLPGDIGAVGSWVGDKIGLSPQQKAVAGQMMRLNPVTSLLMGPTTADIEKHVQKVTGPFRQAETPLGQTIGNIGGFAAGALMPGGAARRAAGVLLPYAGSEAGRAVGGDTGAIAGAAAGGLASGARMAARSAAPTVEALEQASKAAYKAVDDAGIVVSQQAMRGLADDLQRTLYNEGIDATLHPRALAAFQRIAQAGATPGTHTTLEGIDILRRVAKGAAKSIEPDERRLAGVIRDKIDDFVDALDRNPGAVLQGNIHGATKQLREARKLWSQMRKGEEIEELMERARLSAPGLTGSGIENAIVQEFRAFAKNAKKMRLYSAEEQKAIKAVANGGLIHRLSRNVGRLAPTGGLSIPIAIGATWADPSGIALPIAGIAGRGIATRGTKKRAALASELVRGGGSRPQSNQLVRALLAGQGAR